VVKWYDTCLQSRK